MYSIENFVCACVRACVCMSVRFTYRISFASMILRKFFSPHTTYPRSNSTIETFFTWPRSSICTRLTRTSLEHKKGKLSVSLHYSLRERGDTSVMPRVQVANNYSRGGLEIAIVCMPVYRPLTSHTAEGEGSLTLAPQYFAFT